MDEDRIQAKAREPLRGIWAATLTPFADERRRGRVATEPAPLERRGDDLVLRRRAWTQWSTWPVPSSA
ncbi:MAG: hypothetical protein GY698_07360 [Actinomycetia bacterium]|nr:hypothetical protein [Actinomycetes bacterium]